MEDSELKLLKAKVALLEKINAATNSIIYQIEYESRPILKLLDDSQRSESSAEVTLTTDDFYIIYRFIHRASKGQFDYMSAPIAKLIEERSNYKELLGLLS